MTVKQANGHFKEAKKKHFQLLTWGQDTVNCMSKPGKTKIPNPDFALKDVTHCPLISSANSLSHSGGVRRQTVSREWDAKDDRQTGLQELPLWWQEDGRHFTSQDADLKGG